MRGSANSSPRLGVGLALRRERGREDVRERVPVERLAAGLRFAGARFLVDAITRNFDADAPDPAWAPYHRFTRSI